MSRQQAASAGLLAVGVFAVSLLLRAPITALPPSLEIISADLGLSSTAAGATTSLPLVCFGVFAFLAPFLILRLGLERTMLLLLLPLLLGIVVRSAGGVGALYVGAVLVGVGIAIGNVLLPAFIRARFADRLALMMGTYVAVLQISGAVGSAVTAPLEDGLGWGWRPALAVWALPVALLIPLWIVIARRRTPPTATRAPSGLGYVMRRRLTWAITLFMAVQAAAFYTMLTWIPAHLTAQGVSPVTAGVVLGLFSILGLPGAFLAPRLATGPRARLFIVSAYSLQAVAMIGFSVGPGPAIAAAVVAGVSQGAGFSIALTFIADQPDPHDVPAISALAQGVGYLAAAVGPVAIGALHELTGSWFWPDLVITATVLFVAVLGGAIGSRLAQAHDLRRLAS
ncbi:CP family cyanate transporter-like MFS transporter [Kineosphaera limosa]|uniref:Major facilitator superfamily (MFS) profile domain-containing protein n=1 Tax=Kineosphaera limosa NBRC 100340 TaxID=1184609 RepID=K6W6Z9_9MICO|nr:MFS transporter [Kineosphaera limosa]NYE00564.1 CP family cyanate transporter-like MFS transporter [Kineosphaera limosa]GAB94970.1 hypothetical protein KILIM_015_00300 [Kineosphaera limosa NBRC 100340]